MISQVLVAVMDVPHRWTAPPSRIDLKRANSRLSLLRARNIPTGTVQLADDSPVMVLKPLILGGLDMEIPVSPSPATPKRNLKTTARAVTRVLFKKKARSYTILEESYALSSTFSIAGDWASAHEAGIRAPDNTLQTQPLEIPAFSPRSVRLPSFGSPPAPSSLVVCSSQSDYSSDMSFASSMSIIFPRLQLTPSGSIAEGGIPFGSSSMLITSETGTSLAVSDIVDDADANMLLARINLTAQKINTLKRAMDAEKALLEAQKIHMLTHEGLLTNLFARVEALELAATSSEQQWYRTRDVSVSARTSVICSSPPVGLSTSPALGDDTMKNLLRETTLCFSPATETSSTRDLEAFNHITKLSSARNYPSVFSPPPPMLDALEDTSLLHITAASFLELAAVPGSRFSDSSAGDENPGPYCAEESVSVGQETSAALNSVAEPGLDSADNTPSFLRTMAGFSDDCAEASFSFGDEPSMELSVDLDWVYRGIGAYSAEVPLKAFRDTSLSLQVMPATSTNDISPPDSFPMDLSASISESAATGSSRTSHANGKVPPVVAVPSTPTRQSAGPSKLSTAFTPTQTPLTLSIDERTLPVDSMAGRTPLSLSGFSGRRSRSAPLGAITAFTVKVTQSVLVQSPPSPVKSAFSGFIQRRSSMLVGSSNPVKRMEGF